MAARLTAVYLAGPANLVLRLTWLVFLALVARALVHRLINRITSRAADAPLHSRLRQNGDTAPARRKRWRRGRSRFTTDSVLAGTNTAADGLPPAAETATTAVHEAAAPAGPRPRLDPPQRRFRHDLRDRRRDRSR
jgi:hypothetical protein